jgi:hypothetical protein
VKLALAPLAAALVALLAPSTSAAAPPSKRECVAASESGQDLRVSGKLHDARAAFAICVSGTCPRPVREDCAQKLAEIDATMPTLVLVAKDAVGNDLAAAFASVDGESYALDGNAVDVDPGPHHIVFRVQHQTQVRDVVAHEGDKNRRVEVVFGAAPVAAPPAAIEPAAPPPRDAGGGSTQRWIGVGLGVGGAVGIIVGSVLSIVAKATYDHAIDSECMQKDPGQCSPQAQSDSDTVHSLANGSTAAFIGGGALLAAGAALYFTAPGKPRSIAAAPAIGDRSIGVAVRGIW